MELRWEAKLYNWHLHLGKENENTKAALPRSGNIKIHSWTLWPEHTSNWNSKAKAMQFCTKHPVLGNAAKLSLAHQVFQIPLSVSSWGSELLVKIVVLSNIFYTALLVKTLPQDSCLSKQMLHYQTVQHFNALLICAHFKQLHKQLNAVLLLHR